MTELTLLKLRAPEERHSPELRYTFERCVAEARRAFSGVDLVTLEAGDTAEPPPVGTPWILLMDPSCVLLTHHSLQALRRTLEERPDEEAAGCLRRLPETDLPQRFPLYTLRGFERAEGALLEEMLPAQITGPGCHRPVSLFRAPAFARLVKAAGSVRRILEDGSLDPAATLGPLAQVGLCHPFSDYYGEARRDILPLIPEGTERILEIGCGRGVTAQFLKDALGCSVTGVELNPEIAREAREHLDEVLVGDVQSLRISQDREPFDLVLALELFEHLTEGEAFLQRARGWLRPGGAILLSVPNVGHFSILEDLLAGRWDYLPQGLLCYTHYRFFTRATLEDWLRRCALDDYDIVPQKTPLPEVLPTAVEAAGLAVDRESLATTGFYVRIRP
jgi:SAM-dependent methyltransferase